MTPEEFISKDTRQRHPMDGLREIEDKDKRIAELEHFIEKINDESSNEGLNLRDWFAGQALQGILVNAGRNSYSVENRKKIATDVYRLADEMMEARI